MNLNQPINGLIIGKYANSKEAYLSVLRTLLNKKYSVVGDSKIKQEARLVCVISPNGKKGFAANKLKVFDNYEKYGDKHNTKAIEESKYYQETVFDSKKFAKAITLLKKNPSTKKAIIDLNDIPKPSNGKVPCLTYYCFRILNKRLNMYVHMRANNAFCLSLINIDINQAIHRKAAKLAGIPVGEYYHFVDSFHVYHSEINAVKKILDENK